MNNDKPLFIDIHALQTVPPNNMNRDDTGSPKTAQFGGAVRQRVSSQAWKRAIRDEFAELVETDELGQRTQDAVSLIAEEILALNPDFAEDSARELGGKALATTGIKVNGEGKTGYLLFLSRRQARELARLALSAEDGAIDKKAAKSVFNVKENPALNALDIAMFGRMVADAPDLNVDAAVQVAHAIGIGRANAEFDYFTALDDLQAEEDSGAAMIGTTEFVSSTLYRYASIDVRHLFENLGSVEATRKSVEAFFKSFIVSMPTGKQNSFANRTLPSAVVIQLRQTQPVSLVNAFEVPVEHSTGEGTIKLACDRLVEQEEALDNAFGITPEKTYVIEGDPSASALDTLRSDDAQGIVSMKGVAESLGNDVSAYLDGASED